LRAEETALSVLELLGDPEASGVQDPKAGPGDARLQARLSVFRSCPTVIAQIPAMIHDARRPEDVLKVDVDEDGNGGDDAYDALRYGVMVGPARGTASSVAPGGDGVDEMDRTGDWLAVTKRSDLTHQIRTVLLVNGRNGYNVGI
jgi:hypothetical protein